MISMRFRPRLFAGAVLGAFGLRSPLATAQQSTPAPTTSSSPPTQPANGPGGADYAYDEVVVSRLNAEDAPGEARGSGYWLFEPAAPRPVAPAADTPLPLVIFLVGGMEGTDPDLTQSWINHLVRRGAVVVFPSGWSMRHVESSRFQVSAAVAELESGDHMPVDLNRVAVVGQGFGGPQAARMAVVSPEGLPAPAALMVITPDSPPVDGPSTLSEDLAALSADTRVVLVGADRAFDSVTVLDDAWAALAEAGRVPTEQRSYVVLQSDDHGAPPLAAEQWVGVAVDNPDNREETVNALDWYGTWKFMDSLMACTFDGEWCEYAFGNTPVQRYMGTWSDGVPVAEAIVAAEPEVQVATPAG